MNQVALRRLIGGSLLVWVVCTVVLMTHPVMPQQQRVVAQAAPTAAATQETVVEQTALRVFLPLVLRRQGTTPDGPAFPANPAPSSAAFAYRVTANAEVNWRDTERPLTLPDGTQETVSLAYSAGYNTIVGDPLSTIILFFGRQIEDPLQGWGVDLPADAGGYQTEAWVIEVAQEFIDGYERRYAGEAQLSLVVIGTSSGIFIFLEIVTIERTERSGNMSARLILVGAGLASIILLFILVTSIGLSQHSSSAQIVCPTDWAETGTREQRAACIATAQAINDQSETAEIATAFARSPRPITPRPTVTPGAPIRLTLDTLPDETRRIEPITDRAGGPHVLRSSYAASVWHVSALITPDGFVPYRLYVYSVREQCAIGTYVYPDPIGGYADFEDQHTRFWDCPYDAGELSITGATGPTGVVTATDEFSRTITFDLTTEAWTLEGEPWLPTATPTP
ncbi:MAG: hypothetical protein HC914_03580 [Chloroflexaceae bacterium]|nr:hypothetical protein [Chloroflexaceae bacterium]